jgi:hypothetical protein
LELLQTVAGQCPWCGEPIELIVDVSYVDCSYGDHVYVEDCQVCCAPIQVRVSLPADPEAPPDLSLVRENE